MRLDVLTQKHEEEDYKIWREMDDGCKKLKVGFHFYWCLSNTPPHSFPLHSKLFSPHLQNASAPVALGTFVQAQVGPSLSWAPTLREFFTRSRKMGHRLLYIDSLTANVLDFPVIFTFFLGGVCVWGGFVVVVRRVMVNYR
jgi:hypothetical protein